MGCKNIRINHMQNFFENQNSNPNPRYFMRKIWKKNTTKKGNFHSIRFTVLNFMRFHVIFDMYIFKIRAVYDQ